MKIGAESSRAVMRANPIMSLTPARAIASARKRPERLRHVHPLLTVGNRHHGLTEISP